MRRTNPPAALSLVACLASVMVAAPASAAEPPVYAAFADAPRLVMRVSPYVEDPVSWTAQRIREGAAFATGHLASCGIQVEVGPARRLPPGDVTDPTRLWRTDRQEEFVAVLRDPGDRRHYAMKGVADLRTAAIAGKRWLGQGQWTPLVRTVGYTLGGSKMPSWAPGEEGSDGAHVALAKAAIAWAVFRGWLTPSRLGIPESHCAWIRARLKKMNDAPSRPLGSPRSGIPGQGVLVPVQGKPLQILAADVENRDAFRLAVRTDRGWQLWTHFRGRNAFRAERISKGADPGLGLVKVGGGDLLLTRGAKGVRATWLPARRARDFRPPRVLEGCADVLAVDALRPARKHYGPGDPGAALVVCSDRILQLAPFPAHTERADPVPRMTWATIVRRGPARSTVLAATEAGLVEYTVGHHAAPKRSDPSAAARALWKARPADPVWHRPPVDAIQLAPTALHGLGDGPRALGQATRTVFNPQLYRVARSLPEKGGVTLRIDDLYGGWKPPGPTARRMRAGTLWAGHTGDHGPFVYALTPTPAGWCLSTPLEARPDAVAGGRKGGGTRYKACPRPPWHP